MIAIGQLDHTAVIGQRLVDLVDCHVEIEQQRTMAVVAHHALYPEKQCQTHAARDRFDVVQAARRVDHHVAGWEFDCTLIVEVVDHQFAAFVVFRRAQKQGCGYIGADAQRRAGDLPDRIIEMGAERFAAFIAVERRGAAVSP